MSWEWREDWLCRVEDGCVKYHIGYIETINHSNEYTYRACPPTNQPNKIVRDLEEAKEYLIACAVSRKFGN